MVPRVHPPLRQVLQVDLQLLTAHHREHVAQRAPQCLVGPCQAATERVAQTPIEQPHRWANPLPHTGQPNHSGRRFTVSECLTPKPLTQCVIRHLANTKQLSLAAVQLPSQRLQQPTPARGRQLNVDPSRPGGDGIEQAQRELAGIVIFCRGLAQPCAGTVYPTVAYCPACTFRQGQGHPACARQALHLDTAGPLDDFPCAAVGKAWEVPHQDPVCCLRADLSLVEDLLESLTSQRREITVQLLALDGIEQACRRGRIFQ